jgi:N utilization substance protein B
MAPAPQKFREIVFQLLYSSDFDASQDEDISAFMMGEFALSGTSIRKAQERRNLIVARLEEIDPLIAQASSSYSFDRIPSIERTILRLGIFELIFDELIPPKVAIAEAIRLARKYATPEGGTFVNAVLDALYKKNPEAYEIHSVPVGKAP